jgi:hypothetical protein
MTACRDVIGYLDELLEPMAYDDYGLNGLQVPGRDEIESVATGVSANAELLHARARGRRRPGARPPWPVARVAAATAREPLAFIDVPNPI